MNIERHDVSNYDKIRIQKNIELENRICPLFDSVIE